MEPQQNRSRLPMGCNRLAASVALIVISSLFLNAPGCAQPAPSSLPGLESPPTTTAPAARPWAGTESIEISYEWTYWQYDSLSWTWSARIPAELYEQYSSRPRPTTGDYTVFAADDGDREILADLADTLTAYIDELNLDQYERIHFIANFVQQLEYISDIDSTGFDDYGRYPIETLVEGGGDCEDTAILLGKLMDNMGYDVVLVRLPEHMALGVREAEKFVGTYYEYEGSRYFYLETTGEAGRIGMVPDEYKDQAAYIYDFSPRPIVTHDWNGERARSTYRMSVTVENHGAAELRDCSVQAGFDAGDDQMWGTVWSDPFTLAAGESIDVPLTLHIPDYPHTRLLVFIVHRGYAIDKSNSRWFDEEPVPGET